MVDINGDGVSAGGEVLIADLLILAAVIGALIAIFRAARSVSKLAGRLNQFFDDWYGEEPREGRDARPGVLVRLQELETWREEDRQTLRQISTDMALVKAKVSDDLADMTSTKDAAEEALKVAKEIKHDNDTFRARYDQDQALARMEWEVIFATVREMIGKDPEQQLLLWDEISRAYKSKTLLEDE